MYWGKVLVMSRKIYLIRHGKINVGNEKRYIGITDIPLNEEGTLQVLKLKKFFEKIDIEKVYLSPLKRCVETANLILEGRNIKKTIVNELMEINMGEWEGKTFGFIKNSLPDQFKSRGEDIGGFVPTGGESFKNLEKRAIPAFESIVNSTSGNVIIISHAGVNRIILKNILSISMQDIFKINQPYGCINELSFNNGEWNWKLLL